MFKGMKTLVKHLSAVALLASITLGSASFASQANADQFDPLLDGYFAALAEAESMVLHGTYVLLLRRKGTRLLLFMLIWSMELT